ncbi:hypothetical protein OH76DRAFT_908275 [Lentinus brumalis]|uniref:Uncharacterized protein n=1 Tax=Lentinus brumalis TaxID=2498619 RepID=A0A371D0I2_9APHY|nr:hypothetical protein OH76DRAFT_908275 [Polyporus brumalis]
MSSGFAGGPHVRRCRRTALHVIVSLCRPVRPVQVVVLIHTCDVIVAQMEPRLVEIHVQHEHYVVLPRRAGVHARSGVEGFGIGGVEEEEGDNRDRDWEHCGQVRRGRACRRVVTDAMPLSR